MLHLLSLRRYKLQLACAKWYCIISFVGLVLTDTSSNTQGRPSLGVPPEFYTSMFSMGSSDNPAEQRKPPTFGSHRKALAVLGSDDPGPPPTSSSGSRPPSLNPNNQMDYFNQEPVSPWSSSPKMGPTDGPGTFYNDFSEQEASPSSTTFRSGPGRTYGSDSFEVDYGRDHRRPSAASATTISSQGSKSSGSRFRKKLQGFFGDEYLGSRDQKPESEESSLYGKNTRLGPLDQARARERANSDGSRHISDANNSSRPMTPLPGLPSSDITPWDYQNLGVSPCQSMLFLFCSLPFAFLSNQAYLSGYSTVWRGTST